MSPPSYLIPSIDTSTDQVMITRRRRRNHWKIFHPQLITTSSKTSFIALGVHIIWIPRTVADSFNAAGSSSSTLFPSQQFIL
eukprot:scaffold3845_cov109-Skeletonema_marinoi.AAC.5